MINKLLINIVYYVVLCMYSFSSLYLLQFFFFVLNAKFGFFFFLVSIKHTYLSCHKACVCNIQHVNAVRSEEHRSDVRLHVAQASHRNSSVRLRFSFIISVFHPIHFHLSAFFPTSIAGRHHPLVDTIGSPPIVSRR